MTWCRVGRDAIQKVWQGMVDSGVAGATLTTTEVAAAGGGTAYEVGRYELTDKSGKSIDHGKYIVIWTQETGRGRSTETSGTRASRPRVDACDR
jgi:ketosteroid isomerase-like protein